MPEWDACHLKIGADVISCLSCANKAIGFPLYGCYLGDAGDE